MGSLRCNASGDDCKQLTPRSCRQYLEAVGVRLSRAIADIPASVIVTSAARRAQVPSYPVPVAGLVVRNGAARAPTPHLECTRYGLLQSCQSLSEPAGLHKGGLSNRARAFSSQLNAVSAQDQRGVFRCATGWSDFEVDMRSGDVPGGPHAANQLTATHGLPCDHPGG